MNDKKIIMAGLANNKTSLGEVFRRYVDCFKTFSKPDVFDLQQFTKNEEFKLDLFPQYKGPINHDVKYFHSTFNLYRAIKEKTKQIPRSSDVKKIGYFVWESSELHSQDAEVLKDFDEIWTASKYCKDVFSQYIDSSFIKVIPHPIPIPAKLPKKYKNFTILIMGNISSNVDRKNIVGNLEVAKIIKQKYKDVNVIFKTMTGSDNERNLLKQIVGNSKIKVIDEYYSSEKVQDLIGKCHVLLSLHRSEGFGLTLAEAMAVGTVPIATGYSGNVDFMKDVDFLVDYKLVDVSVPYFKGQWAEPNKNDAISKLEKILNERKDLSLNIKLSSSFSFNSVINSLQNLLK
jgi:glycosyltransferase involved in cell wall biosynthesis